MTPTNGMLAESTIPFSAPTGGSSGIPTITPIISKSNLLSSNPWIRDNTKRDLIYMDRLSNSTANPTLQTKSNNELQVTAPHSQPECSSLFSDLTISTSGCQIYTNGTPLPKDQLQNALCGVQDQNYWMNLSGSTILTQCQDP